MIEPIIISAGLGFLVGVLLARKVPRTIIKEVLKNPFRTADFNVKENGDGTKDITVERKDKEPYTLTV